MKLLFATTLTLCLLCVSAYAEPLAKSGSGSIHTSYAGKWVMTE
jgi:hypothetical protein